VLEVSLVVDASVAVEYLLRTELGESVAPQLEASTLLAPELLDVEVLAVIRRAAAAKQLTATRAQQALDDLAHWDVERVPHRRLLNEAWKVRANVSAYDAFYVATAALYGAPLLTADGPLSRTPRIGIVIHHVRG
jgi:predicted nucleic acid-binding protein